MNKAFKYLLIVLSSLAVLFVAAILIIPALVDVERYKPQIERLVTEKTGYPLVLGGPIDLSLFPWVGLSLKDLRLDNPAGFASDAFVSIEQFEARLKVLPLLSRNLEVDRFVVQRPEINLEKRPDGTWNWQRLVAADAAAPPIKTKEPGLPAPSPTQPPGGTASAGSGEGFALQSLFVGEFSIENGRISLIDQATELHRELQDFSLHLEDVSLDKPIRLSMAALLDGKPLAIDGTIGPLGPNPATGSIDVDFTIQLVEALTAALQGRLQDIGSNPGYEFSLAAEPFSPKELLQRLGLSPSYTPADPQVLEKVGLSAAVTGDASRLEISEARMLLDDTTISLTASLERATRPAVVFTIEADAIDLDRYLPAAAEKAAAQQGPPAAAPPIPGAAEQLDQTGAKNQPAATQAPAPNVAAAQAAAPAEAIQQKQPGSYDALRALTLDGKLALGTVNIHGGTVSDISAQLTGQNGLFTLDFLEMKLYEGALSAKGSVNLQQDVAVSTAELTMQQVQVGPLLRDFTAKDIIEGRMKTNISLSFSGDDSEQIISTLGGSGEMLFQDGALIGIDLAELVRTIQSGFTLTEQTEKPKTDFAELRVPFSINDGLFHTDETTLKSPFIRVAATGDANLVTESLDLRVKPSLVGTIKGQGDIKERSGLTVPIIVGGTFADPTFRPDLEGLVRERLPDEQEVSEILQTGKVSPERQQQLREEAEKAKQLFKGLFGN